MKAQRLFTVLAALVVSAPVGAATWYAYGTYEPDTPLDAGWMWRDANQDPATERLYFNVYPTEASAANPNTGSISGSRVLVAGVRNYHAVLGIWTDCNGDETVGRLESAITVYRAELLLDDGICPPGTLHNNGGWVWEYIPVGYQQEDEPNVHPVQITDEQSRVWGDFGLPGAAGAATCPIYPLPHGTTAGTGWAIRYADCFVSKRITNSANEADPDGALGIGFYGCDGMTNEECQNNPQYSDSLLNQQLPESLFGNPVTGETGFLQLDSEEDGGEEEAAFTTWDCSGDRTGVSDPTGGMLPSTVSVDDPTYDPETGTGALGGNYGKVDENLTDDGYYAWVAEPAPTLYDPMDSYADGLNNTFRGVHTGGDMDWDNSANGGTCETEGEDAENTYSGVHQTWQFFVDGDHEGGTQVVGKNKADIFFTYSNGNEQDGALGQQLGTNMPADLGIYAAPIVKQRWTAGVNYATTPQSISRATLAPQPGLYLTFYAKLSDATMDAYADTGNRGFYGSEACGDSTSGIVNGWECDSENWYLDSNGHDISDPEIDVRVHEIYQFRDVDCDDGTLVRGVPAYASLVLLSDAGPCADSA